MISVFPRFDQPLLDWLTHHDPVVQRYRAFFSLFDWSALDQKASQRPGPTSHPESAYIKAFLVKVCEQKEYITQLRVFLLEHPLLVLELGFLPHYDPTAPYGFHVRQTVPCDRWLRSKLHALDRWDLHQLLQQTIHALQEEIPGLGETMAVDVKHIYSWFKENNPRVNILGRFFPKKRPAPVIMSNFARKKAVSKISISNVEG